MLNFKNLPVLPVIVGSSVMAASITPARAELPLTLSIEGGAFYDDNITVDAQDLTSNEGDAGVLIQGAAGLKISDTKPLKLRIGYDFYQSLHSDLSEFDLQIHGLSTSAHTDLGGVDAGGSYRYDHILLGGNKFLDMHTVRPDIGISFGPVYLDAAYEFQRRNFADLNDRDADRHSLGFMAYFSPISGTILNAGYKRVREKAEAPQFTYWGDYIDVGFKTSIQAILAHPTFRASYRYYHRNYSNITPSIGVERSDTRHRARASLEMPILVGVKGKVQYEYIKSNSNLPSLDYNENVITLTVGWEL